MLFVSFYRTFLRQFLRQFLKQLLKISVVFVVFSISIVACNPGKRFQVTQKTKEQCIIRVNGEFCDTADKFPADVTGDWSLEVNEDYSLLYHDEEIWLSDKISGEHQIVKRNETIVNNCTNIVERRLIFKVEIDYQTNLEMFTGSLEIKKRTEGPEICGATPFGDRHLYQLSGRQINGI